MANRKDPLYKEYLKTLRERNEIWAIERNQNWIELEKPYISGYYMVSDLRFDIKNREDAWVFYKCLELVGERVWCRDKTFKRKLGKGKYEYFRPGFGTISEDTYDNLHPAVKKYFKEISIWDKRWNPFRKLYECSVPSYYFVDKIKPRWITHYKEHDELIKQMEAEACDKIENNFAKFNSMYTYKSDKPYSKARNRADRSFNKMTLKRNLKADDIETYEYRHNHRHSALWDCW